MQKLFLKKIQNIPLIRWHELLTFALVCILAQPTIMSWSIGLTLTILGMGLRLAAIGYRPSAKWVIAGPYRFVRHPYYLGTFLLLFGFCVASRSTISAVLGLLGMLLVFGAVFREEELFLSQQESPRFREYRMAVSSFLPSIVPFPHRDEASYSWRFALLGRERRELDTLIAVVVGYACLFGFMQWNASRLVQSLVASALIAVLMVRIFYTYMHRQTHQEHRFVGE